MKCLILGASGQVGGRLLARCEADGIDALGTCHRTAVPGLDPLDLCDADAVSRLVGRFRPDVVFLPAAMTYVDHAENHPARCFDVNVNGTIAAARAARACHARLVFFSTDHVFGPGDWPRGEDDPVAPMNVYAQSKVAGEDCVRAFLPDAHLILRTSWVYGPEAQGKNFVVRAAAALGAGLTLTVPRDQYGQPTYGPDLAAAALELARRGATGTYHAVGPDRLSRYDFARTVAHAFGLDASLVRGVPTAELNQSAPRPLTVRLCRDKLANELGPRCLRGPVACLREMAGTAAVVGAFS